MNSWLTLIRAFIIIYNYTTRGVVIRLLLVLFSSKEDYIKPLDVNNLNCDRRKGGTSNE